MAVAVQVRRKREGLEKRKSAREKGAMQQPEADWAEFYEAPPGQQPLFTDPSARHGATESKQFAAGVEAKKQRRKEALVSPPPPPQREPPGGLLRSAVTKVIAESKKQRRKEALLSPPPPPRHEPPEALLRSAAIATAAVRATEEIGACEPDMFFETGSSEASIFDRLSINSDDSIFDRLSVNSDDSGSVNRRTSRSARASMLRRQKKEKKLALMLSPPPPPQHSPPSSPRAGASAEAPVEAAVEEAAQKSSSLCDQATKQKKDPSKKPFISPLGRRRSRRSSTPLSTCKKLRPILRSSANTTENGTATKNCVRFSVAQLRFYDYRLGEGVPRHGGPALGFGWEWRKHGELELSIANLEELRGSNELEAGDEEAGLQEQEKVPLEGEGCCRRTQRQQFQEHGTVPLKRRFELLKSSGHRRASIDLNTHVNEALALRRRQHSESKAGQYVIDGLDIDVVHEFDIRQDMALKLSLWGKKCAERWRARQKLEE
jgi:hypothetical protein